MSTSKTRAALAYALLATTAFTSPLAAQEVSVVAFPIRQYTDENGVDLATGAFTAKSPTVRVGSQEMGLTYVRDFRGNLYRDTMLGTIDVSGSTYTVSIGSQSEVFTLSGSTFTPTEQNGSSLSLSNGTYTYRKADGTQATFMSTTRDFGSAKGLVITSLTYPSGRSLTFFYHEDGYTNLRGQYRLGRRLQSVTSNTGYHIKFRYGKDEVNDLGGELAWSNVTNVKGLNSSVDSCAVTDFSCPQTGRPELTISGLGSNPQNYTDSEGRVTSVTFSNGVLSAIRLPGSTSDDITVSYTDSKVSSVTAFGVTTGYSYADSNGIRTVTVTRPGGSTRVLKFDISKTLLLEDRNETGQAITYQYDTNNRLARITNPEGNYIRFTYDSRGNILEVRETAKTGTGLSDIVTTSAYPADCSNPVTCNLPVSTTDALGNTTNYSWDTTHGGLITLTSPAPVSGTNRPQTRISYARLSASGAVSSSGTFRPTAISVCQTNSSCSGTADEVKVDITYGQGLLPSTIRRGAGNSSVSATLTLSYDTVGNLATVDGPLSGTGDTVRYRYNLNREMTGITSADPDGAGTLKHRAQRITYNGKGQISKVENGTVNSQSDADWTNFASLEALETTYDAAARPSVQKLVANGATQLLTQISYDGRGRPECVAERMNSAAFGSLPSSACTLGTEGSFGPDRIMKTSYDATGQVIKVENGYGTASVRAEATAIYSANGRLATLTDAENNKTTYEYDGHDRLFKTLFPSPTKGAGTSSTTDYEQLSYDAASNVTSRRLRDGQSIAYGYDNLGRLTSKNLPGTELDVTFGYDLLGRMTSATQTGNSLTFTYDALGRNLSQAGPHGTVSYTYDAAGRRTRITYPGTGLYVDHDYLVTGEVSKIRENGATSGVGVLATYAYDNLGRRTSVTFGNGTVQGFGYDPASRLSSLTQNLYGTANDLTLSMSYSPSSEISSQTRSNDLYAFTGHVNGTTSSTVNGLNQVTAHGGTTITHDARGNITNDGTKAYSYSSENMLKSAGTTTFAYDPLMRLYETSGGASGTTRFLYDGIDIIAEYDGANALKRRFVHGPGIDEPIIWYEGTGTSDRRFLHADERGSIIALTDSAGVKIGINAYDDYGQPAAANIGRFQYTGQAWLSDAGLYHYKARAYSAMLGRFMQTDPIGYEAGMNLYAYVKNNPINFTDPMGLRLRWVCANSSCGWKDDGLDEPGPTSPGQDIVLPPPHSSKTGGGGGGTNAGEKQKQCSTGNDGIDLGRKALSTIADIADAASIGLGMAAVGATPTVVGAATLGTAATVAKGISFFASIGEAYLANSQGDRLGAGTALAGAIAPFDKGFKALRNVYKVGGRHAHNIDNVAGVGASKITAEAACTVGGRI